MLTPEQIEKIKHMAANIEDAGIQYAEIRIIFKKPYWRHIQIVSGETLSPDGEEKHDRKQD